MNIVARVLISTLVLFAVSSAQATSYTWDLTYDGTTLSETSSGSGFAGAILSVNDDFELTVRAAGDGFWTATGASASLPINPSFDGWSGTTTANAISTGFLDGVQVFQDTEMGASRAYAELGVNSWSLPSGLLFDLVVLDYTLLSTNPSTDPILSGQLWDTPFRGAEYTAVEGEGSVPVPAPLALLGIGMLALGYSRLKKAA